MTKKEERRGERGEERERERGSAKERNKERQKEERETERERDKLQIEWTERYEEEVEILTSGQQHRVTYTLLESHALLCRPLGTTGLFASPDKRRKNKEKEKDNERGKRQ